jgi:regulator of protease activity HflC (stomatin/prohibitin superfamily)
MKKAFMLCMAVLALCLNLGACTKVDPGYVAVKVNLNNDRGVKDDVVGPGRYMPGPNTTYYEFPTFTQNYVWTQSGSEGAPGDESISFQTQDNIAINADFGVAYHIEPGDVPKVFQKYRKGVQEITDVSLRNMVRDSLNEVAGKMTYDTLNGDKPAFMKQVVTMVQGKALPVGITVESLSMVGEFRPPEAIKQTMIAKMNATQNAIRVENEVRQTKAEAEKRIVTSQAEVEIAKNEALATQVRGEALAKDPLVLKAQAIAKWDGHLPPSYGGNVTPFIDISK